MKILLLSAWLLTGCCLFAQPRSLALTNTAVIAVRKSVAFEPRAARVLSDSLHGADRMKIYSIGANQRPVATNDVPVNALPSSLANSKLLHIIPTDTATATNQLKLGQARVNLPLKVGIYREIGGTDAPATFVLGDVFLSVVESPLRWNSEQKAYATDLAIGVDFPGHPEIKKLPEPLTLQLLTQNATVEKADVVVTEVGPPYRKVRLKCSDARQESSVTAHHPLVRGSPLKVECAIELGELRVDVSEPSIPAYGLGTCKGTVRRLAKDGIEIRAATPLEVSLTSSRGKLDPGNIISIPENQASAVVELRSAGRGPVEIRAESGNVKSEPRTMSFAFPAGLIVATLLGGSVGGCGRWLKGKKTRKSFATRLLGGLVFGVLIVAAACAGIIIFTLPPIILATELGAFVSAGLAGYLGSAAMDKLVKKFG